MSVFHFKHFSIRQTNSSMRVGTDAMLLGAFVKSDGKRKGFDVGTGTGVISLMLCQRNSKIQIDAIELDDASFEECCYNFSESKWSDRLSAIQANFSTYNTHEIYDVIFSNPPYYQTRLENDDQRVALAKHESSLPMANFVSKTESMLAENGEIWIIIPSIDKLKWKKEFEKSDLFLNEHIDIIGKRGGEAKRSILSFSRANNSSPEYSQFTVRTEDGLYTEEYRLLTKDFHYKPI